MSGLNKAETNSLTNKDKGIFNFNTHEVMGLLKINLLKSGLESTGDKEYTRNHEERKQQDERQSK